MSFKIAVAGVGAAVGLGLLIGGHMRPALALRTDAPVSEASADAGTGPVDLTPAYVSPASLKAWREAAAPARFEPDRIDVAVRRELAQADDELRASESALDDYHRAAVLVRSVLAAEGLNRALSPGPDAAGPAQAAVDDRAPMAATPVVSVEAPASADQRRPQN